MGLCGFDFHEPCAPYTGRMLAINNIQESNTAKDSLDGISGLEIASGYLDIFPDRWIIKIGLHDMEASTISPDIE